MNKGIQESNSSYGNTEVEDQSGESIVVNLKLVEMFSINEI